MKDRTVFCECQTFKCVPHGVPQVQCFTYTMFERILFNNILFYLYGLSYKLFQIAVINTFCIKIEQLRPVSCIADESVFQHLRIAGEKVLSVQAP